MAVEIERKFLVASDGWRVVASAGRRMVQGYLVSGPVEVRVRRFDAAAHLTIKAGHKGIERLEFEYDIPLDDADALLRLCGETVLEKTRHEVVCGEHVWEIDVYGGRHAGLIVAEVELDAADEAFEAPDWLGGEVSGDPRYSNVKLARSPALDGCA
jgi:adenylate cyclase